MLEYSGYKTDEVVKRFLGREPSKEEIKEKLGEKAYRRVKTISTYWEKAKNKEVKEPLLLVFGGMPAVGKSTLSAWVARSLDINIVIGGDGFRSILRNHVSKEENPAFFTSVYKAWQVFGGFTPENVIKGFEAQARILNADIERLIVDRGIRDGESMSVDFLHFLPSLWHPETLEHPSVIAFVLYVEDEERWKEYIQRRVEKSHLKGGWERLIQALDSYKIMRDYQLQKAKEYKVPIIATDNMEEAKEKILDIVEERINKLVEIGVWKKEHPMVKKVR